MVSAQDTAELSALLSAHRLDMQSFLFPLLYAYSTTSLLVLSKISACNWVFPAVPSLALCQGYKT